MNPFHWLQAALLAVWIGSIVSDALGLPSRIKCWRVGHWPGEDGSGSTRCFLCAKLLAPKAPETKLTLVKECDE